MIDYNNLVNRLPLNPDKPIIWIVYNEDMLDFVRSTIASIRGYKYVLDHVKVVTRADASKYNGHIYFDPNLMDQIGCGNS